MKCFHCEAVNKSDAKFCRGCGNSFPPPPDNLIPASQKTPQLCIACNSVVKFGAKFCGKCGATFPGDESPELTTQAREAISPEDSKFVAAKPKPEETVSQAPSQNQSNAIKRNVQIGVVGLLITLVVAAAAYFWLDWQKPDFWVQWKNTLLNDSAQQVVNVPQTPQAEIQTVVGIGRPESADKKQDSLTISTDPNNQVQLVEPPTASQPSATPMPITEVDGHANNPGTVPPVPVVQPHKTKLKKVAPNPDPLPQVVPVEKPVYSASPSSPVQVRSATPVEQQDAPQPVPIKNGNLGLDHIFEKLGDSIGHGAEHICSAVERSMNQCN